MGEWVALGHPNQWVATTKISSPLATLMTNQESPTETNSIILAYSVETAICASSLMMTEH